MGLSNTVYHGSKFKRLNDCIADFFSGGLRTLSNLHSHIHEGKAFGYVQNIGVLADDAYLNFEIVTPLDDDLHLKGVSIWISEGPVLWDITEAPTLTPGVTALTPRNLNRKRVSGSPIPSGTVLKSNPTGVSGGTSIYGDAFQFGVAGLGSQTNESTVKSEVERVLERGERTYLARLQNKSGGNISASLSLVWYE